MTLTVLRRSIAAVALFSALALVAACSGTPSSSLLSPTGPSGILAASAGSSAFNPSTGGDPCAPTIAAEGFTTNPGDPPPPPPPPPPPCLDGRFTGGGFSVGDVKVTMGFTLHCDALLSNNFEVNWPHANNFHIDKNQPVVECSLVGTAPNPPNAGANRIVIVGTGTFNGVPGVAVTLVLEDHGEPGTADRAYIEIDHVAITPGSVAAPALIDGGNIQAHFDQPHKD